MDSDKWAFVQAQLGFTGEYPEYAGLLAWTAARFPSYHQGSEPKMATETTDGHPGYPWRPYYMKPELIDDLTSTKKVALQKLLNLPGFNIAQNHAVMEITDPNQLAVFALDAMHDPNTPESDPTRVAKRLQQVFEAAVYVREHESLDASAKLGSCTELFRWMVHKRLKMVDEKHWLLHWESEDVGRILNTYGAAVTVPEPQACGSDVAFHNMWVAAKRWVDAVTPNVPVAQVAQDTHDEVAQGAQDTSNAPAVKGGEKPQSASTPSDGSASSRKAVHPQAEFSDPNAEEPFE